VKSKTEAIELTKRFLAMAGGGESEIREMHDQPAFDSRSASRFADSGRERAQPEATR